MGKTHGNHQHSDDDPWGVGGNEYREDQFITRSTDGHGHQRHMRVNVPPEIAARVEAIVAKQRIPAYRTSQDLIRDAIAHRLQWLENNVEGMELSATLSNERRKSDLQQVQHEVESLNEIVEGARKAMSAAAQAHDWWALQAAIEMAEEVVDEIRQPYRSQLKIVARRFKVDYARQLATRDEEDFDDD